MRSWLHFAVISAVFIFATCQDCSSPESVKKVFGGFMGCIKDNVTRKYAFLEDEIREHNREAIKACFSQSISDGNDKGRCVLSLNDLENKAWDRNGPLRDCSICRTFANGAIKALLATPPDEQRCIREEVSKAVNLEATACMRGKIADFPGIPPFPDFEEGSFDHREDVINSVSDHILIHSRLAFCAERKQERAEATKNCLKKPFPGYFQKHCDMIRSCETSVPPVCLQQIQTFRAQACGCIEDTRKELKSRIANIAKAVRDVVGGSDRGPAIGSGSKIDHCISGIKSQVRTDSNDWVEVIDTALAKCLKASKPGGQNLGLDSLINVGCRKVIADTTGTAHIQLKAGFDFINNLIDAMVDRSGRFCGSYC